MQAIEIIIGSFDSPDHHFDSWRSTPVKVDKDHLSCFLLRMDKDAVGRALRESDRLEGYHFRCQFEYSVHTAGQDRCLVEYLSPHPSRPGLTKMTGTLSRGTLKRIRAWATLSWRMFRFVERFL